ncbi:MAG TPA: Gfo/Idh/MocA family oxidoreductase [Brevundimonas sp.]|uniref:Gfo/Idh/MocA family protein n=1 Tax=Brevundimonas sp. TaxID=1871086 RepID=UPI002C8768FF|nr:Gfo/Idh/MocA family oxidoreductase [Brevundimonas sp.]HRH19478.1 Gfo/Idh/MocA family oxidoreductase [Brevundimonas sp.]
MNRRGVLAGGVVAAGGGLLAGKARAGALRQASANGRLRLGMIGVGMRGRVLLRELVRRDDVEVVGLCDLEQWTLDRALEQFTEAGKPAPRLWTGSHESWREMLAAGGLDAVIIATPWEWHAPMAIGAMEAGIAVGCEVVAGVTLDDHWDVLRTQQRTNTPYMLLENVCFRRDVLAITRMVREGVFGEMIHLEGGYQHDLRDVKFNAGIVGEAYGGGVEFGERGWSEARWRTDHSVQRNGDLYPSHGIGPMAVWANIHRGNRFTRLTSYASKARGLHDHVVAGGGPDHPNARVDFRLGDVVTTSIVCADGTTMRLTHDTNLPRPYSLGFRVQGQKGLWMDVNRSIYVEGSSPQPHRWEEAQTWLDRYDHALWSEFAEQASGAGHGGMDFFVIHVFIEALKAGTAMPIDVHDAVAWSAITPLSEQSIANGNATVDFPDFTEGGWETARAWSF